MPKKTYTPFPQLKVQLPPFKGSVAVTLGSDIRQAAESVEDLPPSVTRAIALMVVTHQPLVNVWVARLNAQTLETIMRHERNAVRAMYGYLLRLSRMISEYDEGMPARASTVLAVMFPKGMRFTTQNHAIVYAEMDHRLCLVDKGGLRSEITEVGGGPMLRVIEKIHRAYRLELHRNVANNEQLEESLRALMEAFLKRVRMLVVHIYAWLDECPERTHDALTLLETIETIGKMQDEVSFDAGPSLAQTLEEEMSHVRTLSALLEAPAKPKPANDVKAKPSPAPPKAAPPAPSNEDRAEFEPSFVKAAEAKLTDSRLGLVQIKPPTETKSRPGWIDEAEIALKKALDEATSDLGIFEEEPKDDDVGVR